MNNKLFMINLDIIIPTYNNPLKLCDTLNSIIFQENIHVFVVDDGSTTSYEDIIIRYPQVTFYKLENNQGPGMARQYALNKSNSEYITFIDSGDYFIKNGQRILLEQIESNPKVQYFTCNCILDLTNEITGTSNNILGSVFKRTFLQKYNISFFKEGSYVDEDYGFNTSCRLIIAGLEDETLWRHINIPIFVENIDFNSVTKINNQIFFYSRLSEGLIINGTHAIETARKAGVKEKYLIHEYNFIMAKEYYIFLCVLNNHPEFLKQTWDSIYKFYHQTYKKQKEAIKFLPEFFYQIFYNKIQNYRYPWNKNIKFDILNFLKNLESFKVLPEEYKI